MNLFVCLIMWTTVVSLIIWRTGTITTKAITHLQRLHKIPCSNCSYFTGDYRLKCTVRPFEALSEQAIDCLDFELCSHNHNNFIKGNIEKENFTFNSLKKTKISNQNCQNRV